MDVDVIGGTITSADFFLGAQEFADILSSTASGSNWELNVGDSPDPLGVQVDLLFTLVV